MDKNLGDIRAPVLDTDAVDIHILGFHKEQQPSDYPPIDKSLSPVYTIHYIMSGIMYAEKGGEKIAMPADTLFVHFPKANIVHYPDANDPCSLAWITLDGLKVSQYLNRLGITEKKPIIRLWRDEKLRTLFLDAPEQIRENRHISDFISFEYFYAILKQLSAQTISAQSEAVMCAKENHIAKAISYINGNYQDYTLSLDTVASFVGISSGYLSIAFKEITGNTFSNYLFNKRLTAALSLIDDGQTHVGEIAYKCGFNCPFYFSSQFKKYNLISPKKLITQRMQERRSTDKKKKKNGD